MKAHSALLLATFLVASMPLAASTGTGPCTPGPTVLCLGGNRFQVTALFDAGGGNSGAADVVQLTPDTGYLWFFASSNVEAVVKVLNGCVTTYTNPPHTTFQPIQDTSAFAACSAPTDDPPHAAFTVDCSGMACTVHSASFDNDSTPVARWLWDWGDGTPVIEPTTPYRWADQTHTYVQSGNYTIKHTVYDTAGLSDSTSLTVLANLPPVAADDMATTDRDVPTTIDVLANDSDPDGDALSIRNVDLLQHYPGAAYQIVPSGTNGWAITVTPPDNFVGTMTFTYQAADPWGASSAPATVTLVVNQF